MSKEKQELHCLQPASANIQTIKFAGGFLVGETQFNVEPDTKIPREMRDARK